MIGHQMSPFSNFPPLSVPRARRPPRALSLSRPQVFSGDLLPRDAAAEGEGGAAGEEGKKGSDVGNWGRRQ